MKNIIIMEVVKLFENIRYSVCERKEKKIVYNNNICCF